MTHARMWRQQRGSALLLTLLLTLAGAFLLGLGVDTTALLWARSNAQTTANLAAGSVAIELEQNPSATLEYLTETARAAAAQNGIRHGTEAASVAVERQQDRTEVLVAIESGVYFLRAIRPRPVAIRARAAVKAAAL